MGRQHHPASAQTFRECAAFVGDLRPILPLAARSRASGRKAWPGSLTIRGRVTDAVDPRLQPLNLLGRQIVNAMTIVLLAAMAVSFGTQDWIAAGVIAALVILNVSVGFSQVSPLFVIDNLATEDA